MRLNEVQRSFVADKLMDSANYALAGLVFGGLIARAIQPLLLVLGLLIYLFGWVTSLQLRKGARAR